ncbi:Tripartite tricarboxylate transporter family receptor [Neomoorella glycerini]|uniref:Tripartite tricarboxylate transporter family receptor n=1 Tax=Neomoorella glycerini TaxID=55779 RepID=A0A6I5ZNQ1_9FIRM|nr:tripartite tricarboxylate transporter substrate binding protein [Moorella glycerini]QGP91493.1 Tripartite tricarboxylate transporter family receptor [Moorella glycerini]
MKNWRLKGVALGLAALLLVLTLSLAGCGGSEQAKEGTKGSSQGENKAAIDYPTKPVEMTVLFGAGSGADLLARKVAEIAGKELGQPISVVNRTGAGGATGYTYVKGQKADGYNIVWNSNSINTAYHAGNMNFDYKAFSGVAELTTEPVSIAVKADAPWKDINEFIDYAKKNPGKVRIGNSGKGSFTHLAAVALENKTGVKFTHVPFGQGLAVSSLLGGQIEASSQLPAEIMSQVKAGQVRILAVTGEERLKVLPDVPTFKEKGIDLTLSLWRGIAVPAGTPEAVISKLEAAMKKVTENEEFKKFAAEMGANIEFRSAKDFDKFIAQQDQELASLMEQIGMKKQ